MGNTELYCPPATDLSVLRATEPSSPVPLILKRGLRLAEMDFVQIIKQMAPDAIGEIYRIADEKAE